MFDIVLVDISYCVVNLLKSEIFFFLLKPGPFLKLSSVFTLKMKRKKKDGGEI